MRSVIGSVGPGWKPKKAAEGRRSPKRKRDTGRGPREPKVLECGSPLPLFCRSTQLTDRFNRTL